jgi:exonuclease VII large subunit
MDKTEKHGKKAFYANFDQLVYGQFQAIVGYRNVSKRLESFMESVINNESDDHNDVDIQILRLELEESRKKLEKYQLEVASKQELLGKIESNMIQNEKKRLENEKQLAESLKRCLGCNDLLSGHNKTFQFTKGLVCRTCYRLATHDQIRQWRTLNEQTKPK